jgi:hypothetical protein
MPVADICQNAGIDQATHLNWKAQFGGLNVSDARRL